jgi:integrase
VRNIISAAAVAKLSKPGRYAVGNGAYLQISKWGTKSWLYRYQRDGRSRHMGLGPAWLLSLAEAREKARDAARLLLEGVDPLEAKRRAKHAVRLASVRSKTFCDCAQAYIAAHEAGWRTKWSRNQWISSLEKYVYPKIGDLPVADIDVACVLSVLEPIWTKLPETGSRIRGRVEAVLDWARARELRSGENPAAWKGRLDHLLASPSKLRRVQHLAAMKYSEIGAFMNELRNRSDDLGARTLEFAILTAVRPSEVLGARWSEIDGKMWIIPAERMKGNREHRVPLSGSALELLAALPRQDEFVFAGRAGGQPSPMTLIRALRRAGRTDVTAHGFRSTFRDWAAETTAYPNHVVEMALAHAVGNTVEAAYRRGDLFEKRRWLMEDWAKYCDAPVAGATAGDVVALRGVS